MGKKRDNQRQDALFIDYRELGTISIDELAQAIYTDIQALKDIYNVKYVTAPRLKLPITNEYGDIRLTRHPEGHLINRMDTHHYRPACKDYDL
ncbi:hypothetical protein [Varunaivibrio sulfuroxidans]|uniref:Uncharacterized protein n=1 Tax=Varunaivibrio sulfuroxidans TaxID=1773489 RepID=A0A4R3J607_9PROT|nr:hypothetical protein [Varunaivibrio sulfuroxidans]TCS59860.1 hypothetical protein EDD55_1156 [Varunaivibrio sulfuroxidans]WES29537.1 hypothetical protein P3M64_07650 [Varunaivibrio sulfuroxidans]